MKGNDPAKGNLSLVLPSRGRHSISGTHCDDQVGSILSLRLKK